MASSFSEHQELNWVIALCVSSTRLLFVSALMTSTKSSAKACIYERYLARLDRVFRWLRGSTGPGHCMNLEGSLSQVRFQFNSYSNHTSSRVAASYIDLEQCAAPPGDNHEL
ncbi:hypothetical protein AVEN_200586-1 [Araneus ventricosus]|uniref:Uncharacterized protein n=1 Tax=Araneus ventricosus TaxID=182803 RepID=A0A4Y2VTK5_ARAVE|nr:hypothetical protein AVEN_200586-1 [Araneus ventricosus]